jgi:hypothetical protein
MNPFPVALRLKVALAAYAGRNHFTLPTWVERLGK